ncbi:hypothetical protein AKO1_006401 [Acrasis kona]|uniref:Homologous recombination OB-fold protein OB-fold domain-containing protein n=1 Tax=Acrasis kona TaxID=1008807 RepID=A0AAW2YLT3_9EUKA
MERRERRERRKRNSNGVADDSPSKLDGPKAPVKDLEQETSAWKEMVSFVCSNSKKQKNHLEGKNIAYIVDLRNYTSPVPVLGLVVRHILNYDTNSAAMILMGEYECNVEWNSSGKSVVSNIQPSSRTIRAMVSRSAIDKWKAITTVGSVVLLKNVSIFKPTPETEYLIITVDTVLNLWASERTIREAEGKKRKRKSSQQSNSSLDNLLDRDLLNGSGSNNSSPSITHSSMQPPRSVTKNNNKNTQPRPTPSPERPQSPPTTTPQRKNSTPSNPSQPVKRPIPSTPPPIPQPQQSTQRRITNTQNPTSTTKVVQPQRPPSPVRNSIEPPLKKSKPTLERPVEQDVFQEPESQHSELNLSMDDFVDKVGKENEGLDALDFDQENQEPAENDGFF